MKCVKYMIFAISITFAVVAAMLLWMAVAIGNRFDEFQNFIDSHFFVPPNLLIAIGISLLVISLFGCVGALMESKVMINIYGALLLIVFILQLAAASTAFVMRGQVSHMVREKIYDAMANYIQPEGYSIAIDMLQDTLECCGVDGYTDWAQYLPSDGMEILVPVTCCSLGPIVGECNLRDYGCYSPLSRLIAQGSLLIATGTAAAAAVQLLGAVCAFMLASAIPRANSQCHSYHPRDHLRRFSLVRRLLILLSVARSALATNARPQPPQPSHASS